MPKLYYTAPKDELFEDLKTQAIALWKEIDTDNDKFGYATEKISAFKDIGNIGDNFMYIVAMFDYGNQRLLAKKLKPETIQAINERLIDGGTEYGLM